jgi:hypothetical protein|tara:strand:- start:445 stop:714 length:270 start_codon:yes stop_codon:yes gene_type:complete
MPHKPTKISVTPPLGKRNYRKEYDNYHASPEQKKKRASRNAARNGSGAKAGQDVHHKNGNPLDNRKGNLAVVSPSSNRSFPRDRNARKT